MDAPTGSSWSILPKSGQISIPISRLAIAVIRLATGIAIGAGIVGVVRVVVVIAGVIVIVVIVTGIMVVSVMRPVRLVVIASMLVAATPIIRTIGQRS
jgi:hypothetical protein